MDAISCLPAALSLADAAIARALRYSMAMASSDSAASCSSSLSAPQHHSHLLADDLRDYAPPRVTTCDSVLVDDSPPGAGRQNKQQLAVAGGRAGKQRRSRASKRAPTTYISTDPANFRIMVQHITGLVQQADHDDMMMHMLLHPAAAMLAADASAAAGASYGNPLLLPVLPPLEAGGDEASAIQQQQQHHQQQQPCFPTLDSWNVMYERTTPEQL
ncbi:unnamed protein product [Urochloa decumbens]|uniref:VQ domain-containing protein n=1 Tax=Urochloa decumbens TaxID=240449 RepID=A0ABC9GSP2_9POAL